MSTIRPTRLGTQATPGVLVQPTNASFTTLPILTADIQCVFFQIEAAITGTPVATLKLQGSVDGRVSDDMNNNTATATWTDMTLPAGAVHGTTASFTFSGPAVTAAWDGTVALNTIIDVTDPPTYLRLVYTLGSGGSATPSLIARVGGRGRRA